MRVLRRRSESRARVGCLRSEKPEEPSATLLDPCVRTLTVLTAIFLPLNLITGFFGMNFESLPLIHSGAGFWIAFFSMLAVGAGLALFFWRKRYLGTQGR